MERRLGRIQAGHPQVSDLYDVTLRDTPDGVRLQWSIKPNSGSGIDLSWCDGFDKVSHVQEFGSLIGSPIR